MDEGSGIDGLFSFLGALLGAIFGALTQLLVYLFSFVYLLVSPLLYLGHGLLALALLPLRVLIKFEAFLYFVTGAVLTGVTVGLFLHFTGGAISQLLRLQSSSPPPYQDELEDIKEPPFDWETKWRDQYLSTTILEEEETSQGSG